ncbi:MAG: MBL fold metallo-hydrolase [Puniceicoccales bacterium]|jgi:glyoxylase-like metal-dependent hydrolase (beta-lactamase superfamily II)|nr:MBL fold metallo-hydrolase [Puniceicoccales bacterium]
MKEIFSNHSISIYLENIGPLETNVGFIVDRVSQQVAVIDAPPGIWDLLQTHPLLCQWTPAHLLITHGHWDHMTDAFHFAEHHIPLWAGEADAFCLQHPEIMTAFGIDMHDISPCAADRFMEDGKVYEIFPSPSLALQAFHVPGHSPGSFAYYFPSASLAFVGDTLFAGGVGRSDLPGGQKSLLFQSIRQKLYTLPQQTIIIPGHGPLTSIAREKQSNPYVGPISIPHRES